MKDKATRPRNCVFGQPVRFLEISREFVNFFGSSGRSLSRMKRLTFGSLDASGSISGRKSTLSSKVEAPLSFSE